MEQPTIKQMTHLLNWMLKNNIQHQNPDCFRVGYDDIKGHLYAKPSELIQQYVESNVTAIDARMADIMGRWGIRAFYFKDYDWVTTTINDKIEGFSMDDAVILRQMLDERYGFMLLVSELQK